MRFSVSRVGCFNTCPYQFKLKYIDELETLPDYDDPQNALYLGSALHKGVETTVEEGIKEYFNSYPIIGDAHINEAIKLAYWIPRVKALLPDNAEHEVEIAYKDTFIGYIDLLVKNDDGTYDIYDFKYSNNIDHYMESVQLHVYKDYFEEVTHKKVRKLFFVFVPKVAIRQKKTETVQTFRNRLYEELGKKSVQIKEVPFDINKVAEYFYNIRAIKNCKDFNKNENRLCDWCDFQRYCKEGVDYMILPKAERRLPSERKNRNRLWIYGMPFSGKTTLADKFPMPLMLNTDGNAEEFTSQSILMKDVVKVNGRITTTTLAWEVFKSTIDELEKGSDFKTIVVDLVEDLYESCRLYMYKQMGITHESDDSFRAWDKVRTEFLSTMRRLMNLDYENIILISHEDTSKDVTKRSGDKISSVRPNIQEKIANKLAGMVDVVMRAVVIDGKHKLSFKSDEVVFGGGRIDLHNVDEILNDYETLMEVLHPEAEAKQPDLFDSSDKKEEEAPKKRTRKPRDTEEELNSEKVGEADVEPKEAIELTADGTLTELESDEAPKVEEAPVETATPRRRRRRTTDESVPF